jgi:hypothetical protein
VGLFSLYSLSTFSVIAVANVFFLNAFLPSMVYNKDSVLPVIKKIDRVFVYSFPIWVIGVLCIMPATFLLAGDSYHFSTEMFLLFTITSFAQFVYCTYVHILSVTRSWIAAGSTLALGCVGLGALTFFQTVIWYLVVIGFLYLFFAMAIRHLIIKSHILNH